MGTTTAAVKGAAGGAASGAVAGPEGAAAGAAAGAAGGAKAGHDAKKAARAADGGGSAGTPAENSSTPSAGDRAKQAQTYGKKAKKLIPRAGGGRGSNPRRMLVAEFVVCTLILALSPLSGKHKNDDVVKWMARGGAISIVFLVLGLTAAISDKAGRVAAAMGMVIMVGLLVSDADVFQNFLTGLQVPQRKSDGIDPGTGDNQVPPTTTPPGATGGVGGEGNFDLGFGAAPNWNPLGGN